MSINYTKIGTKSEIIKHNGDPLWDSDVMDMADQLNETIDRVNSLVVDHVDQLVNNPSHTVVPSEYAVRVAINDAIIGSGSDVDNDVALLSESPVSSTKAPSCEVVRTTLGNLVTISNAATAGVRVADLSIGGKVTTLYAPGGGAGGSIDVDDNWYEGSTNPVQSKVLQAALVGKVNVVPNKQLSTNDYSDVDKAKLSGIVDGANIVSINPDFSTGNRIAQITVKDMNNGVQSSKNINLYAPKEVPEASQPGDVLTVGANNEILWVTPSSAMTPDTELSADSANMVENRVIKAALDKKMDAPELTEADANKVMAVSADGSHFILSSVGTGTVTAVNNILPGAGGRVVLRSDNIPYDTTGTTVKEVLDNKVGVEVGKGLSTNDFTNTHKTKVEGLPEHVASTENIADAISALDVADVAVAGKYVSSVSETDGKISVVREDLPKVYDLEGEVEENGKSASVDSVNEALGKKIDLPAVDGTAGQVLSIAANGELAWITAPTGGGGEGTGGGTITAADILTAAQQNAVNSGITAGIVSKVNDLYTKAQIDSKFDNVYTKTATDSKITSEIAKLDASEVGGNGKYITSVKEVDGVITAVAGSIDSSYSATSDNPASGKAIADALSSLDVTKVGEVGKVLTSIKQDDGKITATEADAVVKDAVPSSNSFATFTVAGSITKVEDAAVTLTKESTPTEGSAYSYTLKQGGVADATKVEIPEASDTVKGVTILETSIPTSAVDTKTLSTKAIVDNFLNKETTDEQEVLGKVTFDDEVEVDSLKVGEVGITADSDDAGATLKVDANTLMVNGVAILDEDEVDDKITEAIEDLDVEDTAVADKYISQVSQEDGKITVTRADIPVKDVTLNDVTVVENKVAKLKLSEVTETPYTTKADGSIDTPSKLEVSTDKASNLLIGSDVLTIKKYVDDKISEKMIDAGSGEINQINGISVGDTKLSVDSDKIAKIALEEVKATGDNVASKVELAGGKVKVTYDKMVESAATSGVANQYGFFSGSNELTGKYLADGYAQSSTATVSNFKESAGTYTVPTTKAVHEYLDYILGGITGAMTFKGDCAAIAITTFNENSVGWTFVASGPGTVGSITYGIGDMMIVNAVSGTTPSWTRVPANTTVENKGAEIGTTSTELGSVNGTKITASINITTPSECLLNSSANTEIAKIAGKSIEAKLKAANVTVTEGTTTGEGATKTYGLPSMSIGEMTGTASGTDINNVKKYVDNLISQQLAAKEAAEGKTITDVTINGHSAVVSNVATIPNASATEYGVTKLTNVYSATGTEAVSGQAIDAAIKELDASVTSTKVNGIQVKVDEVDGKVSGVTVTAEDASTTAKGVVQLTDGYSATDSTKAMTGKATKAAMDNVLADLKATSVGTGRYISDITQTDGKITATAKLIDSTYSATGTDPINGAGVANALATLDATKEGSDNGVKVKVAEVDGKIDAVTVTADKATTSAYGVTKLVSTFTKTDETLAMDGKAVQAALDTLEDVYVKKTNVTLEDVKEGSTVVGKKLTVDGKAIEVKNGLSGAKWEGDVSGASEFGVENNKIKLPKADSSTASVVRLVTDGDAANFNDTNDYMAATPKAIIEQGYCKLVTCTQDQYDSMSHDSNTVYCIID